MLELCSCIRMVNSNWQYICTYVCDTYVRTNIYVRICIRIHTYVYVCTYTYIRTYTDIAYHTYVRLYLRIRIYIRICTYVRMHSTKCINASAAAGHLSTYVRTYVHTNTYPWQLPKVRACIRISVNIGV